jgi:hypothetical protein
VRSVLPSAACSSIRVADCTLCVMFCRSVSPNAVARASPANGEPRPPVSLNSSRVSSRPVVPFQLAVSTNGSELRWPRKIRKFYPQSDGPVGLSGQSHACGIAPKSGDASPATHVHSLLIIEGAGTATGATDAAATAFTASAYAASACA